MLTLRRHSIKLTHAEIDRLLLHLSLDTEAAGYLAPSNRFVEGELVIQKPWMGIVSKDKTKFNVRRTRAGIFKIGVSMLEIYGKLTTESNGKVIEIKIRPVWHVTLSSICIIVFSSIVTWNYFNDIFGWIFLMSAAALHILFLILDLNKTEEKLADYVDQCKSDALQ